MSSSTWTRAALSSEARALAGRCWRLVEAQRHVSTLKLVDSVAEQGLLEDLIETTKPPLPPEFAASTICWRRRFVTARPTLPGCGFGAPE